MEFSRKGFTLVELLIVIVVIVILASITLVAYTHIQRQAHDSQAASDINQVAKLLEIYQGRNGSYPVTDSSVKISGSHSNGSASTTYTDTGCPEGHSTAAWVPGLSETLPQSDHNPGGGVKDLGGCYMYQSDGTYFILSAWNMLDQPQTSTMYRRLGFREMGANPFYYCNHVNIGGSRSGTYVEDTDYYKFSYTVSNVNWCNETPPTGA